MTDADKTVEQKVAEFDARRKERLAAARTASLPTLRERHKQYVLDHDKPYRGVVQSEGDYTSPCHACKRTLEAPHELKCIECGWLICWKCAACGCGHSR
jgi:hypothetical protein